MTTTKNFRIECLENSKTVLFNLIASGTATAEDLNNAEYAVALHTGIIHDIEGMST